MFTLTLVLHQVKAYDADSIKYNRTFYQLMFELDDNLEQTRAIFSIDETTGTLSANQPVDREETSEFTFTVIAENNVASKSGEVMPC